MKTNSSLPTGTLPSSFDSRNLVSGTVESAVRTFTNTGAEGLGTSAYITGLTSVQNRNLQNPGISGATTLANGDQMLYQEILELPNFKIQGQNLNEISCSVSGCVSCPTDGNYNLPVGILDTQTGKIIRISPNQRNLGSFMSTGTGQFYLPSEAVSRPSVNANFSPPVAVAPGTLMETAVGTENVATRSNLSQNYATGVMSHGNGQFYLPGQTMSQPTTNVNYSPYVPAITERALPSDNLATKSNLSQNFTPQPNAINDGWSPPGINLENYADGEVIGYFDEFGNKIPDPVEFLTQNLSEARVDPSGRASTKKSSDFAGNFRQEGHKSATDFESSRSTTTLRSSRRTPRSRPSSRNSRATGGYPKAGQNSGRTSGAPSNTASNIRSVMSKKLAASSQVPTQGRVKNAVQKIENRTFSTSSDQIYDIYVPSDPKMAKSVLQTKQQTPYSKNLNASGMTTASEKSKSGASRPRPEPQHAAVVNNVTHNSSYTEISSLGKHSNLMTHL